MVTESQNNLFELTATIVAAYVSRNVLQLADVPSLIATVHQSLVSPAQSQEAVEAAVEQKPAVPIKKSIFPDYIICLEDGKKLKMLKRHLMSSYRMTPDEYRRKWGLSDDYPMVAPNYAKARSDLALKFGLGRRAA